MKFIFLNANFWRSATYPAGIASGRQLLAENGRFTPEVDSSDWLLSLRAPGDGHMHEPAIASTRNDVNMTPIQGISIRHEDQSDAVRTGIEMYGFDSDEW